MQDERQKLEGQAMARSVWNIIVSGVTEQLSQVEQLNENGRLQAQNLEMLLLV